MIIRYNKCMAKKSQSLVSTQDAWLTIQKPLPKKTISLTGIRSHKQLSIEEESIHEESKKTALAMMNEQFTQEFKCATPSEKLLVKRLEHNYNLIVTYEEKLLLALDSNLATANNHALKVMHTLERGLSRCERTILSILQMLKTMKQPAIQVNVLGNAVIGHTQQFNNHDSESAK